MDLNQVTLPTLDVERSIPFYQSLGLELIVHTHPRYARFKLPMGKGTFSIHQVDQLPQGEGVLVYFEVEDLEQTYHNLLEKGIGFSSSPKNQPWLWQEAHLQDPDGNHLVLYHAGENRLNPPWRL
jgi:predicted enzyme related to lactoylglutathione lyase